MLKAANMFMVLVMLQAPAVAASEESSWYQLNQVACHEAHPNFYFLLGDWESSNPAKLLKESWTATADGDLFCLRSYPDVLGGPCIYELIAFQRPLQPGGSSCVQMRQMGRFLCDLNKNPIAGDWSAPTNHRGEIKFHGEGQTILNEYDSPDPNTVNLRIQTTSKGVTISKKLVLKRSAPTKDPRVTSSYSRT